MARRLTSPSTSLLIVALRAVNWLAGVIPRYPHAEALCRLGGGVWYACAPVAREAVRDNLRHVYGRAPTRLEMLRVFQNGALNYWDTFAINHISPDEMREIVDVHGLEHLAAAHRGGKGAVVASAHLGSVAFVAQVVPALGFTTVGLLEPIEPPELYALFAGLRQANGIRLFPAGTGGLRELLQALRRGEFVGLITDREFGGSSVSVPFFDAETRFADGAAALALRTGAAVIIGVCARKSRGRFDAWFEPMPPVALMDGDHKANVRAVTREIARHLQYYVASHPAQWTVFQKRWPGSERPGEE